MRTCEVCRTSFESARPRKYCGQTCRKRAQRRPGGASPVTVLTPVPDHADGPLTRSTRSRLEQADRLDTPDGTAAVLLAERLDRSGSETGGGVASLMTQWRTQMVVALEGATVEEDALEKIRQSAALKLVRAVG